MSDMRDDIASVLLSAEEIQARTAELGAQISRDFDGREPLFVGVLKGCFVFMADLCRAVTIPCDISFMCAKSYYNGTSSCGEVTITMDVDRDISKYHVIIADDIIDTGRTLSGVVEMLRERRPLSLKVITLLDKPARREVEFKADRSLFTIPDLFVIGYGLDCADAFRNLPYIAEYNEDK